MLTLRPYQTDLLAAVKRSLGAGNRAPLVVAPTGSGKTVMFATIARGAASKHNRVLILVHRREILEQTLRSLHLLGVTSGQIAAGRPMSSDPVQTAMVGTLVRRLHYAKRPDLIIVDECHHALSDNSWGKILRHWNKVPRIGFTATPERLDGRGLGESFDDMILGPSISELVAEGFLSYPLVYRPPLEVVRNYHVKRGDFDKKEQEREMSTRRIVGDVIEHYQRHMDGLPVVCFCLSVEHARLMATQFRNAGYAAAPVWGDMQRRDRERAIKGLGDGSIQVVTSCDVISEGVDVPVMAGAILLRRTMSLGLYLQQAGRALRSYPGKDQAVILDHVGNYYLHGHVLADRQWSLDSKKRDPREQRPPATMSCPECGAVWPGRPHYCPDCGCRFADAPAQDQYEIEEIEGNLVAAGLPEGQAGSVGEFIASTRGMGARRRQKATWGAAYEELAQGDEGRRRLEALRRALGGKAGWTDVVWNEVLRR